MRIHVTGTSGFIGSNMKEYLGAEYSPEVEGADAVIHLAAMAHIDECSSNPLGAIEANVKMTCGILRAAQHYHVKRFVYVSSNYALNPWTFYGATKSGGEAICQAASAELGLNVVVLRTMNIYGPRQQERKFIPTVIRRIQDGEVIRITNSKRRRMLYVRDLCEALLYSTAVHSDGFRILSAAGEYISNPEMAIMLGDILGKSAIMDIDVDVPANPSDAEISADEFKKATDWYPVTPHKTGLQETAAYYMAGVAR